MELEIYIFILFAALFVLILLVGKHIVKDIRENKVIAITNVFVATKEITASAASTRTALKDEWFFTHSEAFPVPPVKGYIVHNKHNSFKIKGVHILRTGEVEVIYEGIIVTSEERAAELIQELFKDGWQFDGAFTGNSPLPPNANYTGSGFTPT